MTPEELELTERFENLQVAPGTFHHRDHLAAAYAMLRKYPFIEATSRYAQTIRTMAERAGVYDKFHTTITFAFMALIAERMESSAYDSFDDFIEHHPDLFSPGLLQRFYSPERLASDVARKVFVMPDIRVERSSSG